MEAVHKTQGWGTRIGLILAMAGNAVGLGNFLRFPMQAVQNGGGAFIIPYLVAFLLMGIPLLWVEWAMGRYGGKFGHHSTPFILDAMDKRKFWKYLGVFGIFTNIGVAAYYCYIESWTLAYVIHSIIGTFNGMSQQEVADFFAGYTTISFNVNNTTLGIPLEPIFFYVFCLVLNTYILAQDLNKGIEKVAKIGVPLLIVFGALLAIKAFFLKDTGAYEGCTDCHSWLGINFLWEPRFESLSDPKVWLAAAGQIFFTLSIGMGTIHCYAAYLKEKDDIALNAMSAGWMNEFVEIVLGASVVVPLAVGYLGLDWVKEHASFSIAFQTMPYLFAKWGTVLSALAGIAWFGLLFIAGITSSLAMGTPLKSFMEDEFNWDLRKSAIFFGVLVFVFGLPTVIFFDKGVFDEYDYWAGTVSLVIFALTEIILFSWVFGMDKGWKEIIAGADIKVPMFYRFVIKYITPVFLLAVFTGALITPENNDWLNAFAELKAGNGWPLGNSSLIAKVFHLDVPELIYFKDGAPTNLFFIDMARILLLILFGFIAWLVYIASQKRKET